MRSERSARLIALGLALASLTACVHGKCVASAPGVHGSNTTCCSTAPRYYWTGTRCEPDPTCECDGQPASPTWTTLAQCEDVHHHCGEFDSN